MISGKTCDDLGITNITSIRLRAAGSGALHWNSWRTAPMEAVPLSCSWLSQIQGIPYQQAVRLCSASPQIGRPEVVMTALSFHISAAKQGGMTHPENWWIVQKTDILDWNCWIEQWYLVACNRTRHAEVNGSHSFFCMKMNYRIGESWWVTTEHMEIS